MEITRGTKAAIRMGCLCFSFLVFMLYFRMFVYADMYIAPNEPYGISDIIELFLYLVFLLLLAVSVGLSIILLVKGSPKSKKSGFLLVFFCIILYVIESPLHHFAARLGG